MYVHTGVARCDGNWKPVGYEEVEVIYHKQQPTVFQRFDWSSVPAGLSKRRDTRSLYRIQVDNAQLDYDIAPLPNRATVVDAS
jgi:hypothetical protein